MCACVVYGVCVWWGWVGVCVIVCAGGEGDSEGEAITCKTWEMDTAVSFSHKKTQWNVALVTI